MHRPVRMTNSLFKGRPLAPNTSQKCITVLTCPRASHATADQPLSQVLPGSTTSRHLRQYRFTFSVAARGWICIQTHGHSLEPKIYREQTHFSPPWRISKNNNQGAVTKTCFESSNSRLTKMATLALQPANKFSVTVGNHQFYRYIAIIKRQNSCLSNFTSE